jgi:hypothetical protein
LETGYKRIVVRGQLRHIFIKTHISINKPGVVMRIWNPSYRET